MDVWMPDNIITLVPEWLVATFGLSLPVAFALTAAAGAVFTALVLAVDQRMRRTRHPTTPGHR